MNRIEMLLIEIHSKIDNFLGFEELSEEEAKEILEKMGQVYDKTIISYI